MIESDIQINHEAEHHTEHNAEHNSEHSIHETVGDEHATEDTGAEHVHNQHNEPHHQQEKRRSIMNTRFVPVLVGLIVAFAVIQITPIRANGIEVIAADINCAADPIGNRLINPNGLDRNIGQAKITKNINEIASRATIVKAIEVNDITPLIGEISIIDPIQIQRIDPINNFNINDTIAISQINAIGQLDEIGENISILPTRIDQIVINRIDPINDNIGRSIASEIGGAIA